MPNDAATDKPSPAKLLMSWIGGATAVIGLFGSLAGGGHWYQARRQQQAELNTRMATAQEFTTQQQYDSAVRSYQEILKENPAYQPALDQQLKAAMLWVETFHVVTREGQNAGDLSGPQLDEIMALLTAALARANGPQAADIQAHLGWAHWLNQHIAEREFGPAAEDNLRAALKKDPTNVYANAMLGNWLLQNGGSLSEASTHFATAVATGRERPLVRSMQLGALVYDETPGARAELFKAANDMRKSGEPLSTGLKRRILVFCCDATMSSHAELTEALSAVPPDDAWQTYLWLYPALGSDAPPAERDFVQATILELSNRKPEALEKFRILQKQLALSNSDFRELVNAAIARLSHT